MKGAREKVGEEIGVGLRGFEEEAVVGVLLRDPRVPVFG